MGKLKIHAVVGLARDAEPATLLPVEQNQVGQNTPPLSSEACTVVRNPPSFYHLLFLNNHEDPSPHSTFCTGPC